MATPSIARSNTPFMPVPRFKPMTEDLIERVVSALFDAAQEIDPDAEEAFGLEQVPGYLRARMNFIARAAVRSCFERTLRDGELKARGAVAETLFQRSFDHLSPREQARVYECAKAAVLAYQRHLEGTSGEMLPSERAGLRLPGELA